MGPRFVVALACMVLVLMSIALNETHQRLSGKVVVSDRAEPIESDSVKHGPSVNVVEAVDLEFSEEIWKRHGIRRDNGFWEALNAIANTVHPQVGPPDPHQAIADLHVSKPPNGRVLLYIKGRNQTLTVFTVQRFSVTIAGQVSASDISLDELRTRFPKLHEMYQSAYVRAWAGL